MLAKTGSCISRPRPYSSNIKKEFQMLTIIKYTNWNWGLEISVSKSNRSHMQFWKNSMIVQAVHVVWTDVDESVLEMKTGLNMAT